VASSITRRMATRPSNSTLEVTEKENQDITTRITRTMVQDRVRDPRPDKSIASKVATRTREAVQDLLLGRVSRLGGEVRARVGATEGA
jgi:hypothetical protein